MAGPVRYYIHMADPAYTERPWPGERRFGPYGDDPATGVDGLTSARNQAVADLAGGAMAADAFLGIYDEAGSRARDPVYAQEDAEAAAGWDVAGANAAAAADKPYPARPKPAKAKAVVTPSSLRARVETQQRRLLAQQVAAADQQRADLEALLPAGVSYDEILQLAHSMRTDARRIAEALQ